MGYVGHRGPTRFLRYIISLILSTFVLVKAIRVSRSRILVTMAGHCYSGFVIALVGKVMKRKVIVRMSEPTRALLKRNRRPGLLYVVTSWTERLSLSLSDAVFSVRDMSDYCTLPSGKARVIGQGVSIHQIEECSPADLRDHFSPALVTVARLDSEKGIERLIDSVALLVEKFPNIGCFIVGWGPEMSSLLQRVSERSLESHVVFTGYIPPSQVPRILKACDIFVLPSDLEGVPSAILEAMACGLPVVTCLRTGSFAEMMRKFNAAFSVTTDPQAIADAVETLLINPQQRENIAKSGIRYVRTYHDSKESRKAFSSLILQVGGYVHTEYSDELSLQPRQSPLHILGNAYYEVHRRLMFKPFSSGRSMRQSHESGRGSV